MNKIHNRFTMTWLEEYELAKKYYEHYGDLNIHKDFKTINGIDYDEEGFPLGIWIENQRQSFKGQSKEELTPEQIRMLNNIKMLWYVWDLKWNKMYELAKKYYEHYGNLNICQDFKTINGVDYNEDGFSLGMWINNQRQSYKGQGNGKLTQDQIEKLDSIGMIWDVYDYNWNKMYNLAKKYYEYYGDLNIRQDFKTTNGIDYDADGLSLGAWIKTQRNSYKGQGNGKLTQKQIKMLDDIEMIWDVYDYNWNKMYELAKKYYEYYGDLNIRQDFKTTNGIDNDAYGLPLGMWIGTQRLAYKGQGTWKLTQDQIEKLDSIGMVWFTSDKIDKRAQIEVIDRSNKIKKQREILDRFYSLLNQYDDSGLPDKEMMNQDFINQLDRKSLHLVKK